MINETSSYSGHLRVRVCGICRNEDSILLIRHKPFGLNKNGFWSPPGGGLEYGESIKACLQREFKEETGLLVEVGQFLFVNEFLNLPFHAIEFFFEVKVSEGILIKGIDPELSSENQLIAEVSFLPLSEIKKLPADQVHPFVFNLNDIEELKNYTSFINFNN